MAQQPADAVGGQVARLAGVDEQRALARAAQHEGGAEAGGAAADDDAVHRSCHLRWRIAARSAKLSLLNWQTISMSHVRQRLRELRTERGLTLEAVAARAQIDVSTLSRLESGKRRLALDHVPALAAALGVSTDELLTRARARTRASAAARARVHGVTMWPLTRHGPAGGLHAYKFRISADRREPPAELPDSRGPRLALRAQPAGCACCSATTTSSSTRARPSSSAPGRRTGSAPSTAPSS